MREESTDARVSTCALSLVRQRIGKVEIMTGGPAWSVTVTVFAVSWGRLARCGYGPRLLACVAGHVHGPRRCGRPSVGGGWGSRRVHGPQRADSAGSGRIREERKGEVTGQAGLVRFLGPDAPSFLLLAPLYLLPRALGWCTCVAYRVIPQVGSTRVYYGSRNPMPRVGNSRALIYKEGRLAL